MERTLVEALVELEIQVVLEVLVVVEVEVMGCEVLKQFPQCSDFYGDDPALVVMVVVDPFLQRKIIDQNI